MTDIIIFQGEWVAGEHPYYLQPYNFTVGLLGDGDDPQPIGEVEFFLIYPLMVHYDDLWDAADADSGDLLEGIETFYGENGPLNWNSDEFQGEITNNLLFINKLRLDPDFRGKGLGFEILKAIIKRYGQGVHVAMRPGPLGEPLKGSREEARVKLWNHWKQLNFNREHGLFLWNNCA